MKQDDLWNRLDSCLVEDYLSAPQAFEKLDDPFPKWFTSGLIQPKFITILVVSGLDLTS